MNPANFPRPTGPLHPGSMPKPLFANRESQRRVMFKTLVVVALPFALLALPLLRHPVASAASNTCDLDLTFGNAGKVTTTFPAGLDTASDVALQTDGKIDRGRFFRHRLRARAL